MFRFSDLFKLYEQGVNLVQYMKKNNPELSDSEIVEISYDLQSGTYTDAMRNPDYFDKKKQISDQIAQIILDYTKPGTILEAGIGEGSTLSGVLSYEGLDCVNAYGFDLCWSRVFCARSWLAETGHHDTTLCVGSLVDIPFSTNSMDVVFTSHAIEPNGGYEEEILQELYRVARNYVVLVEPIYELASSSAKARMDSHNYCKGLRQAAEKLGYEVVRYELLNVDYGNSLNPSGVLVIKKDLGLNTSMSCPNFVCPEFKCELLHMGDVLYSPEGLKAYPIIKDIACLKKKDGVIASKLRDFI